jgi:hypothetical protein
VGFVGFIGGGKGAAGDILEKIGYHKESFAKPVKDIASIMFGWERNLLEGDTTESRVWRETKDEFWSKKLNREFSPRLALQLLGTEVGRNIFADDFWVNSMEARLDKNKNYVITDVRFPNEINWINENNGIVFEVSRGEKPEWYNIAREANNGNPEKENEMIYNYKIHFSEWAWIGSNISGIIQNDGTLGELEQKLKILLTNKI